MTHSPASFFFARRSQWEWPRRRSATRGVSLSIDRLQPVSPAALHVPSLGPVRADGHGLRLVACCRSAHPRSPGRLQAQFRTPGAHRTSSAVGVGIRQTGVVRSRRIRVLGKNRRSRVDVVPSTAPAIRWPPDQRDNVGRTPGSHRFRRRSRPCPVRAARRARWRATTRARTDRTVTLAEGAHETREARTPFHGGRTPRGV